ncbi:MAG: ribonuclease D [Chloroflexi bacterium]|nr:ribonuclease D [Chloroflexota bacterium]
MNPHTHPRSKKTSYLPPPIAVTNPTQLAELLEILSDEPTIAVDTESNSLYAYQEQVCLIQVSIPDTDYIIDPLTGLDLASLGPIFADPEKEKIFHAAEYDVMCLKRDFDFNFENLFDTMWAGRILGWSRVGLGDVLKKNFDVRTKKRYQRYDWGKRPLEAEALAYACIDTHYLLDLRQIQLDELMKQGRTEEAKEAFDQVAASKPPWHTFSPDDFWRIKGSRDLSGREQAVLRELCIWRDQEAHRRDRPHFKVLNDHTLVALAQIRPRKPKDLIGVDNLKYHHIRQYGERILRAIQRGVRAQKPQLPSRPPRHSEAEVLRFRALRAWRKQVAADRGVDSDVIISNAVLWTLAEQNPRTLNDMERIEGLGPWKQKTYGTRILQVLRRET